jgi:heme/copper-type cytochrome/quinol oxidase subunit 2
MNNRGNGLIVVVFGVLFIIAGIVVEILTASGALANAINSEILQAINVYFWGTIIAIVLVVIGILILFFGLKG